ncbi:hypothetical protein BDQ17DRAFT_1420297 [Cyathus striatus]|nr:hypothetical protein BDQ17DRAFT_1420297 [Cyathus striatus]
MSKRRVVPAGLRSELDQYSSLLRALRTRSTRNVTAQLSKPPPRFFTGTALHRSIDGDDDHSDDSEYSAVDDPDLREPHLPPQPPQPALNDAPGAGPSDLNHPSNSQSSVPVAGQKRKRTNKSTTRSGRDLWTRWPLPINDVEVPEFTLEEELVALAKDSLKRNPPPLPDITYQPGGRSTSYGTPFIRNSYVTDSDSDEHRFSFLSSIFALLSAHTQPGSASTRNRVQPMDWKSILDILSIFGDETAFNVKTLKTTLQRLEALYGSYDASNSDSSASSQPQAPEVPKPLLRMNASLNSMARLRDSFAELDASLFSFPPRPPMKKKPIHIEETKVEAEERQEERDRLKVPAHWNTGASKLPARQSRRKKAKITPSPELERGGFDLTTVNIADEDELWTLGLDKLRELADFHGLNPKGRRTTAKGLIQVLHEKGIQDDLESRI